MKTFTLFTLFIVFSFQTFSQAPFPFEDTFESGTLNSAYWTASPNINGVNGVVELDDGIGLNNSTGVKMGKTSDSGGFTANALDLSINLSDQSEVELTFWINDYDDATDGIDGLYFSDNGGANFEKVLDFLPEEWCNYNYGQFPPIDVDELASLAGLNVSTSQFVIRFAQRGDKDFSGTSDGFYIDNINVYDPNLIYKELPAEDDFENGQFQDFWAWNFADQTAGINADEAPTGTMNWVEVTDGVGINNSYGVAMGRRCDDVFTTNALDLHLNLAGEDQVELTFWLNDYQDATDNDDGLYFSDDGGESFEKVLDFLPDEWCDYNYGQFPPIDVDQLAEDFGLELSSTFVIRFQQRGDKDFSGTSDGFYLDNVNVYDPNLIYKELPVMDDFEDGQFQNFWAWNFADQTAGINADETPTGTMNWVEVTDGVGINNSYGVAMGRRCDDVFTTNALDLHLNLAGEDQVELTFWLNDYQDATDNDDGLYFSDDGGESFEKVLDFLPDEWCDYNYGQFPPIDVDQLAEDFGLELSSTFVIRFQQRGDKDFSGTSDGFYIDEVKVYDPNLTFKTIPFSNNFDDGQLPNYWAWNFADQTVSINTNNAPTGTMNWVEVLDGIGIDNSYGVAIGRRCDDFFTTNALDLHLNLEGASNVNLSFWINDYQDETDDDDGLYFSDDGGETFIKVEDFDFSSATDYNYEEYQVSISDIVANSSQLELSNRFVVRFQQRGENDFSGTSDGIYLDNVNVTGTPSSTTNYLNKDQIRVFPSPTEGVTFIEVPGHTSIQKIQIFSSSGILVYSKESENNSNKEQLNLNALPGGLYLISATLESGQIISKKVVKQ
ncbi:MAG: T9SS type A sorting domain-containing protein [Bacteroidetes bacterium]|nr:T9SS type A sorting domain-containing protein [Bacteroidota bacterium]